MQPQKPSLGDAQFKKPATMYKYKYQMHQEEVICYDKQCYDTKYLRARNVHHPVFWQEASYEKKKMCGQGNQRQKQNQVYVVTITVSQQNASRSLQDMLIQNVQ